MNRKMKSMGIAGIITLIAVSGVWAGGGGQGKTGSPEQTGQGTAGELPRTISIMVPLYAPEAPQKGAPVWNALNTLTGHELDLQFVPADSYNDKLNVSIAGNHLPHAACILDLKLNSFVNSVRSGVFWDLTEKIKASAELAKALPDLILHNATTDGRNYVLPRTRIATRNGIVIRKDWLDKLGLKPPQTLNDIYAIAYAFTKNDPDGNGKNDTIGIGFSLDLFQTAGGSDTFGVWGGTGNNWIVQNGKLVPNFSTQEFIDRVLKFYKRLYDEKLMNLDFATIKSQQVIEMVNADNVGIYSAATDAARTRHEPLLARKKRDNPTVTLDDLFTYNSLFVTPEGKRAAPADSGFFGSYAFPKSAVKTEAMLNEIIEVFKKIDGAEGQNLTKWGIQGVTYTLTGGIPSILKQESYTVDVQVFSHLGLSYYTNPLYVPGIVSNFEKIQTENQLSNIPYGVSNPVTPFISDTAVNIGKELENIIVDAQVKFIMGRIDEAGYKAAVAQYMKAGGEQIVKEYNQAYSAIAK
jgi:putative aldouronate transport system substrate-binding protein